MYRLWSAEGASQNQTVRDQGAAGAPTMESAAPQQQQLTPFREGKFSNIWDFISKPYRLDGEGDFRPPRRMSEIQELEAGQIIRISDDGSRLHDRIMLVLRVRPTSLTCLTFCLHDSPYNLKDHWRVVDTSSDTPEWERGTLHVALEPRWGRAPPVAVSLQPNITINIQDAWNVEKGLSVLMLGHVPPACFHKLIAEHKKVYCESLDAEAESIAGIPMSYLVAIPVMAKDPTTKKPSQESQFVPERGRGPEYESRWTLEAGQTVDQQPRRRTDKEQPSRRGYFERHPSRAKNSMPKSKWPGF